MLARILIPALAIIAQCANAFPASGSRNEFLPARNVNLFGARQESANTTTDNHEGHDHSSEATHTSLVVDFPIHESCNASQAMQIRSGFEDMNWLLKSASNHLLQFGANSDLFELYFGKDADPAIPLGYYTRILSGDKTGTLFRCDDIDGNCKLPEWNGHWRGNNATGETVICELSSWTRLPLEKACSFGWTLATGSVSAYWGTDLMHRAMHLPSITNEKVGHTADSYADLVTLATNNTADSVRNQHTLQTFAFEVWSRENIDSAGCVGTASTSADDAGASTSSTAASPAATSSSSSGDCHTHADGSIHCGAH